MTDSGWEEAATREVRRGLVLVESTVDDFDVRAVVVIGHDRALVWDTLAHPVPMRAAARLLGARAPVVAYSHGDWDHVWGTAAFGEIEDVVALQACSDRFAREVPGELAARRSAEPGRWDDVRLVPPRRTFVASAEIDLGGLVVRMEALPGHTADCAVAWIEPWGVLLAGDTVETPLPVVNDGAAVAGWIAALRHWAAEPGLELVVPSHGPVGGVETIGWTVTYLEGLASGRPPPVPAGTPPFYLRTHRENLRNADLR